MSIRGSNGERQRLDARVAALERRADEAERRTEAMLRWMARSEVRMKKLDEQMNRTAKILAGAAEAFKSLDRRLTRLETNRG